MTQKEAFLVKNRLISNEDLLSSFIVTKFEVGGPKVVVTLTPNAKLTSTENVNRNLFEED